jgi:hypothetical protein
MYIGYYGLTSFKVERKEANAMLEYRFLQAQFRRHDPKGLVLNHSQLLNISQIHANEKWGHKEVYENGVSWEQVKEKIKSKGQSSSSQNDNELEGKKKNDEAEKHKGEANPRSKQATKVERLKREVEDGEKIKVELKKHEEEDKAEVENKKKEEEEKVKQKRENKKRLPKKRKY